jgi:hypothetical protein
MPIRATRHIRKMRGGAQAHLLAAEDGAFYVVKAANNPQGRRILVNEWIAGVFLRHLQISTPACSIIEITPEFNAEYPNFSMQLGSRQFPIDPGWHFGSRFPGDPFTLAVFDYVADDHIRECMNTWEYSAILPFDKWASNADSRQSIFYRARLRAANSAFETTGIVTQMIDHGFIFDGPRWDFSDAPMQGGYPRASVYERVRSWDDFQPWLDRIVHFPEDVIDEALRQIPPRWIEGEEDELHRLLERLLKRRKRTPDLILELKRTKPALFPNWHDPLR